MKHHQKEIAYVLKELEVEDINPISSRKNKQALKSNASNLQKILTDAKAEAKAELYKALKKHQAFHD